MKKSFFPAILWMLIFSVFAVSGCGGGVTGVTKSPTATLTSISVIPVAPEIVQGGTLQFTATGTYSDNSTRDVTSNATWASTNTARATVTNTGLATGTGVGTSTISASYNGKTNSAVLTVTASPVAPTITTHPANKSVTVGQTATFSVVASGTSPFTYQWRKDGSNLVGANSASYTTPVTVSGDNGAKYSVVVSNTAGNATSNDATLTVTTTPTVSVTVSPAAATVAPSGTRAFNATVSGSGNTAVTWSVQEGATGGSITGMGQYTAPAHGGVYHVIATSNADATKSDFATITVNDPAPANGAAMTTANRTSGIAPLAVFFDAADTVSEGTGGAPVSATAPPNWPFAWTSGVYQPADMEGSQFEWWFDDPSSGAWVNDGLSKNIATGFTAAHVFETPGSYIVTLRVTSPNGRVDTYKQTITVNEFAGVTHYASASGTGDGTSTATPQSLADGWTWVTGAAGRRLLLNRGDTFTMTGNISIPAAREGTIIGAYGTGSRPLLDFPVNANVTINSPDVTWMDVDVRTLYPKTQADPLTGIHGEPTQRQDRLLVLRSKVTGYGTGVGTDCYGPTILNPNSGMVFQEVENDSQNVPGIGLYVGGHQLAVLGSNSYNTTSHNIRVFEAAKAVVSHNRMWGGTGTYQHALKLHAAEAERNGAPESRWIVVSDNIAWYPAPWVFSIGPQNDQLVERVSHVIVERNHTWGDPGTGRVQSGLEISARYVMMRNNILDGTGGSSGYTGALVQRRGIEPTPYDVRFLNNTVVRRDAGSSFSAISMSSTDVAAVRNNIVWAPSVTTQNMLNGAPTNLSVSNNLPVGTDPQFTNFTGQNYTLSSTSSPAVDAGVTLGEVRSDVRGMARPLGVRSDIGAFECF